MKHTVIAAALAGLMLAQNAGVAQQTAPDAPQPQSQPGTIPDAPKPQAIPGLNNVAPGIGTTSTSNGDGPAPTDSDAPHLTDPQKKVTPSVDDGPAPDVTAPGEGIKAFTLAPVTVNFVQRPFTVKDSKGRLVPGIDWREVRIYENGVRQRMAIFTSDPFPLSVALVIDQSVPFDTMTKVNNALAALQGAFAPYDQIAIFTYNNGPQMQTDFTAAQSARVTAVLERSKGKGRDPVMGLTGPLSQTTTINNSQFDPNTSPVRNNPGMVLNAPKELHTLNDAILEAAVALTKTGRGRRRIIYVISDGKEYGSKAKYKEVVQYLQHHEIQVYGTIVGDSSTPIIGFLDRYHLPFQMRDDILPRYAAATGGQMASEFRTKGIEESFSEITKEVRTQYTVGYYSHEPFIDGKYRKTEVRVLRPNLNVISPDGYYPSAVEAVRPAIPTTTNTPAAPAPSPSN
ncbi:VWFA-related protein [Granulicella aggregans]|uniref:VWFA-related protein n=1 Tax=Granulicella aggregans TaxID=474949 RepID=A0A7W7ZAV7_9BACT|nr:VWFA-related protein [Granulicella aggregans]